MMTCNILSLAMALKLFAVLAHAGSRGLDGHEYPINITEAAYQVSFQSNGVHICGGAIISNKYILSAAHCTDRTPITNLTVRLGATSLASGGDTVTVKNIVQHSLFSNGYFDYDFSLLELETELQFSESIKAIEMPEQNERVSDGQQCFITGWNNCTSLNISSGGLLQGMFVNILNTRMCDKFFTKIPFMTPRMLCAEWTFGGKPCCTGESGGPMVCNGKLVGIISWGNFCTTRGYPGVYSYVATVRDWIKIQSGV